MPRSLLCLLALCACASPRRGSFDAGEVPVPLLPRFIAPGITFGGALAPDGRELYFNTMSADRKTMTMLVSRFDGSGWGEPAKVPFSTGPRDIDPFVTPDGRHLLFESDRARGDFDVWIADREGTGWSAPHPVESVNTGEDEVFATQTAAGEMVFGRAARTTGRPKPVLYSFRPGEAPRPLPPAINDGNTSSNPLIAPDGSFLLFVSDRPGGQGETDLWVSFRERETWREPRNLGPPIDTADGEFAPGLSADGAWLFFTRRHEGQNLVHVVRAPRLLWER
jgi:Tol biopolymer transport system component